MALNQAGTHFTESNKQEMTAVNVVAGRRSALRTLALTAATSSIGLVSVRAEPATAIVKSVATPPGSTHLDALKKRLAQAPRRRDFTSVPMILNHQEQWDHEALTHVLSYRPTPRQAWDNSDIGGPWLYLMRNALNSQIWSFKHPDFLAVSVTHGTAQLALYDRAIWDKYQLTSLAGDEFRTNTLTTERKSVVAASTDYEDQAESLAGEDSSIPALMRRGVVFMSCHNAIWEQAALLLKSGINPDKLSHAQLAAELTNHLVNGVILIPSAAGTLPELQQVGFYYAT
jgi:hypothetical protein